MRFSRLAALVMLAAVMALPACSRKETAKTPEVDPKELFEARCSYCHALNVTLKDRHTKAGWEKIVAKCSGRMMWLVRSWEEPIIVNYLAANYLADKEPVKPKRKPDPSGMHHVLGDDAGQIIFGADPDMPETDRGN